MNLRTIAARIILDVVGGRSLTDALEKAAATIPVRDQALLQAMTYGVCRWYERLTALTELLLTTPLKAKDRDIQCLLLVGLYQLMDMRIPEHAAVSETVKAVSDFKKVWAKQLVNAVLRNFIRQRKELLNTADPAIQYSHPDWMMQKIKQAWPNDWAAICNANNEHPPFSLRVNQQQINRTEYLALLPKEWQVKVIPETQTGLTLEVPVKVQDLPAFIDGKVSVQDGAAQMAAELMQLLPGQRVLDACAAPGGKTAHMLELEPTIQLTAVDIDEERLINIKENLTRLHLTAQCISADVGKKETWWDGQLFDRILLDAPCSASGVIRRHPDIKLLRRESDIPQLVAVQTHLLNTLWSMLKPGGVMVYATCSIFPEENTELLQNFLAAHPEAKEEKVIADWGKTCTVGRQILPGMQGMDGFYYARLRK